MKIHTYSTILQQKISHVGQVTEDVINAVYYAKNALFGQRLASVCTKATHGELFNLFLQLEDSYAGELAHILCTETLLHKKKFTKHDITKKGFVIYRNSIPIFKIEWLQISYVSEVPSVGCCEAGMRHHRRYFKSLLQSSGVLPSKREYQNIHKLPVSILV